MILLIYYPIGDFTFVASLDLAGVVAQAIREVLVSIVLDFIDSNTDISVPDYDDFRALMNLLHSGTFGPELRWVVEFAGTLVEDILSIAVAVIFQDPLITRADFGFDLWYMDSNDIASVANSSSGSTTPAANFFRPVTQDGFRRVYEDTSTRFSFEGGYSSFNEVYDGVRNMVCHQGTADKTGWSDPKLIVTTAVYGSDQSCVTFEVSLPKSKVEEKGMRGWREWLSGSSSGTPSPDSKEALVLVGIVVGVFVAVALMLGIRKTRRFTIDSEPTEGSALLL